MGRANSTPDGPLLHSIQIDPRDPRHMLLATSSGGVFESRDQGADWRPLNKGTVASFLPDEEPEYGQDPHCVRMHPLAPDVLWQQNHCGIYRLEQPAERWTRVGDNMPREVGDIGFPIVLHPRDPDTAWVFPMDGTDVWPRTSPGGRAAVYATRDAGQSWQRQDRGLPQEQAWLTVKRQAMTVDAHDPVGVYFGTTSGELWGEPRRGSELELPGAAPAADPRGRGCGARRMSAASRVGTRAVGRRGLRRERSTFRSRFAPTPRRRRRSRPWARRCAELLEDLDRLFPGIRFRLIDEQDAIRQHMRIFVNRVPVRSLDVALGPDDEVHIFQALSGG